MSAAAEGRQPGEPPARGRRGGALRTLPALTLLAMLGPVAAGLLGTAAPALGLMPGLVSGLTTAGAEGTDPVAGLLGWPGLGAAVRLSLTTGIGATAVALLTVSLIVAGWQGTRAFAVIERLLAPVLSLPHAAAAFGLAFLIAPSGWLVRAVSPWATGWDRPPDLLIVQDPAGLALTAGLVAKEVPFLLLMTIAALGQVDTRRAVTLARTLGYGRVTGWLKLVFPAVYAQIRLPVYVVLAFSMSVVDVAMILGPNTPPTLAVQIVRWASDPDIALRGRAAAGALLQLGLVAGALVLWRAGEIVVARLGRAWIWSGARGGAPAEPVLRGLGLALAVLSAAAVTVSLGGLALWSVAGFWTYPDAAPDALTLRNWGDAAPGLARPAANTFAVAAAATALALALAIGCLEAEFRYRLGFGRWALWALYLPLLVPQVAFLPGLSALFLLMGAGGGLAAVILAHLVFCLPYVFLSLGDPWRAWDARHATVAACLGAGPGRVLWRVRLPMLLAPVLTAAAVGFAVSVGQYLPTLLIGGGRVPTLTTEAVALAAGGDRRAIGVWALAQTAAAFLPFALALALPHLVFADRRGVRR